MKKTLILILACDAGWLPLLECPVGNDADDLPGVADAGATLHETDCLHDAEAVVEHLRAYGCLPGPGAGAGAGVVIGLASHRCYAARVNTAGLPARQLRQALPYRFETSVPFAVEDLVLDTHGHGDDRLVVAAHSESLHTFVHALEDAGFQVCGIAPLALLAAQSKVADTENPDKSSDEVTLRIAEPPAMCVAQVPSVSEVTVVRDNSRQCNLERWRWLPGTGRSDSERQASHVEVAQTLRLAQATVQRVVTEDEPLWVNLQRGPLASRHQLDRVRRPLVACLTAAAILLITLTGAMQVRAWQYNTAAAEHDEQARSLYEEAFPGEAVPVSMDRRLKTKLRELRGRQGLATPDARLFDEESSLAIFHDLLERLPDDTRLIITDLRLSGDRIDIVGHARSHSDADRIAAAMREDGRFEVTPPSTETLPNQGVQFSLNVTPITEARRTGDGPSGSLAADQGNAAQQPGNASPSPGQVQGGTP